MTIEQRYELSCYEELSKLHPEKEVYLVRHMEDGNLYVKKFVDIYNKSVYERLMQLKIPNIPQIFQCVEEDGRLILIEEYIHGSSLQRIFQQKGTFSEREIIQIMMQLCDILEALHGCNPPIVHRDIKPSNIMVSNDGVVKLIDFNAAKEYVSGHIQDTLLMGTHDFAAPEQYGFAQSDQRTDIYAIGVTMNYLLTGNFPKQGLYQGMLGPIIKLCTALDADNRYHNVVEIKADFCNLIKDSTAEIQECQDKIENIFTKRWYSRKKWLPVGWRTGVIWKMVVAFFGYLLILWMGLITEATSEGVEQTGFLLWANRITMLILLVGTVFFIGNYGNIRYQLPFMNKNKVLHWILVPLYLFLFWFMVVYLLALVENLV